jgi:hypothetical protein
LSGSAGARAANTDGPSRPRFITCATASTSFTMSNGFETKASHPACKRNGFVRLACALSARTISSRRVPAAEARHLEVHQNQGGTLRQRLRKSTLKPVEPGSSAVCDNGSALRALESVVASVSGPVTCPACTSNKAVLMVTRFGVDWYSCPDCQHAWRQCADVATTPKSSPLDRPSSAERFRTARRRRRGRRRNARCGRARTYGSQRASPRNQNRRRCV